MSYTVTENKSLINFNETGYLPADNRSSAAYYVVAGNGQYLYCQVCTIRSGGSYVNNPIYFEFSGRGIPFTTVQFYFANTSDPDPGVAYFVNDNYLNFYIKKVDTYTWCLYAQYTESWGSLYLHRISGNGSFYISSIDMVNLSSLPDGCTRAVSTELNKLYPVGSVYITVGGSDPNSFLGGSWSKIASGRCLMGADGSHGAGSTAEAGLPNISGNFPASLEGGGTFSTSGAFALAGKGYFGWGVTGTDYDNYGLNFDASRCSAIYGNSSTVQPPALFVYFWQRTG